MKLIAGLGNPGPRYESTRHNVGYMAVDLLGDRWRVSISQFEKRFDAMIGRTQAGEQDVILLKPLTFMNLSGRSVASAQRFFKIDWCDVLVIHDDLDLPPGSIRIRESGSPGGQKGMADVIRHVGSNEISRVRIGIGRVDRSQTVGHVLSRFSPSERDVIEPALALAADASECWVRHGTTKAMNEFNARGGAGA